MTEVKDPSFFSFAKIVRDVFFAGVFGTGIWVIGEQLEHLGYEEAAKYCNFAACLIYISVLPFELIKYKQSFEFGLVVTCMFVQFPVALIAYAFFALDPVPTPYPHFEFRLLKQSDTYDGAIEFTNDFVIQMGQTIRWKALLFTTVNTNDVTLLFDVQNLGPPTSRNTRVSIFLPPSFNCDAPGWVHRQNGNIISLSCNPNDLLSGDGWQLPPIYLKNFPVSNRGLAPNAYLIMYARADGTPTETVGFNMYCFSVLTNAFEMPFVVTPLETGSIKPPDALSKILKTEPQNP